MKSQNFECGVRGRLARGLILHASVWSLSLGVIIHATAQEVPIRRGNNLGEIGEGAGALAARNPGLKIPNSVSSGFGQSDTSIHTALGTGVTTAPGFGLGGSGGPFSGVITGITQGGGQAGLGGLLQNLTLLRMLLALFQGSNTQQSAGTALSNLSRAESRVGSSGGGAAQPGGATTQPSTGGDSPGAGSANGGNSNKPNNGGAQNGNGQTGQWGSVGNRKPGRGNGSTSGSGTSGTTGGGSNGGTSGEGPAGGGSTVGSGGPNGGAGGSGSPGSSGGATGAWGAVGGGGASGSGSQSGSTQNDPSANKPAAPPSGSTGGAGVSPGTNSSGGGGNLPTGSFFPRGYTNSGM